jgi:glycerol-3-phosphate O-acyltransferase/dihydroxyacetone phosphate acyltransferase
MLYQLLRSAARVALQWYYSDVIVQGRARIPERGPVLIVANHPNALVDAMLVAASVDRRVLLTAKATLFEHPLLSPLLGAVGVVPLRRAKDERDAIRSGGTVARNDDAFRMVTEAFRQNRVVLVFPEGISHDEPSLAQLKSGAARMALGARDAGVQALHILPVGLVFEEKERPRSRVLVRIGDPIDVDAWCAPRPSPDAAALTREIDARLRRVTLNFATAESASRAVRVARALGAFAEEPPSVATGEDFASRAELAARVESATEALATASPALVSAADAFTERLDALDARLAARGIALADSRISLHVRHGILFVLRESVLALFALPIALLGRVVHWLPIRLARALAMQSPATQTSRDQPAMRTIVLALAALLVWYALLAVILTLWLGGVAAVLWLVAVFAAAQVDLRLQDRLTRAWRRGRAYLVLRSDPELRAHLPIEIEGLLSEAIALERALTLDRDGAV